MKTIRMKVEFQVMVYGYNGKPFDGHGEPGS